MMLVETSKIVRFGFVRHTDRTAAEFVRTVYEARPQTVTARRLQIGRISRALFQPRPAPLLS
jgi:hypothetical protein